MIVRRELERARVRFEIERCDAHSVSPQGGAVSSRAPGTGVTVRCRRRARTPAAPPRLPRVLQALDPGRDRRERRRRTKVRASPWSAGHAATWPSLRRAG
jgi:hypothetical protein